MDNSKIELEKNDIKDVSAEVLEHMMNPKNYGKMEDADGVGMGVDDKTGEFVIFYIKVDTDTEMIKDLSFVANGCQDTIVSGSLFSEMVNGDSVANATMAAKLMSEKLVNAPKKQQVCANMVLIAFEASLRHVEEKMSGKDEEMYVLKTNESCEVEGEENE